MNPLPIIRVTCAHCGKSFECQPDDLAGYDHNTDEAFYLCLACWDAAIDDNLAHPSPAPQDISD